MTYRIAVDGYYGATGNFDLYVELTPPVQCSDGVDNDGDGKIDTGDPGCVGATDDDETDPPPPSPPASAPPPPPPPPPADTTTPTLQLSGATSQKVLRQRGVLVVAACPAEACVATAKGTALIRGSAKVFKLSPVTKQIAQGEKAKLKLKTRALTAIRRALRAGKSVRAKVTVTAKDAAGNATTKRRIIKLKRYRLTSRPPGRTLRAPVASTP